MLDLPNGIILSLRMKLTFIITCLSLILNSLFNATKGYANNNDICNQTNNYDACRKVLNSIPPINNSQNIYGYAPIPIEVIPYSVNKFRPRRNIPKNYKYKNKFLKNEDSYLYEMR